ncbi:MAG: hypothetical protein RQ761_13300, partial [Bacteroidales bacterium]|nr:hypothetical protein [Bacteroidales bacterium]
RFVLVELRSSSTAITAGAACGYCHMINTTLKELNDHLFISTKIRKMSHLTWIIILPNSDN